MSSRLDLGWKERQPDRDEPPRRFLDYVVDGESLYDRLAQTDDISCLGWMPADEDDHSARRLLGEVAPNVEDRVALWVCWVCGGVDCGALTARVDVNEEAVTWRDFALSWLDHAAGEWTHEVGPFEGWEALRFDATQYRRAIESRPRSVTPPYGGERQSAVLLGVRRLANRLRPAHVPRCPNCLRSVSSEADRCPYCQRLRGVD